MGVQALPKASKKGLQAMTFSSTLTLAGPDPPLALERPSCDACFGGRSMVDGGVQVLKKKCRHERQKCKECGNGAFVHLCVCAFEHLCI